MNCYLHPEKNATAFCRSCGRPLCPQCQRSAEGTIYCQDHVPSPAYSAPYSQEGARASSSGAGTYPSQAGGSASTGPNPYFAPGPVPTGSPVQTSPGLAFVLGFIPGVGAIYNGQYLKGLVHALIFGLVVTLLSNGGAGGGEPLVAILLAAFVMYMPFEAYHTAKKRQLGIGLDEWSSILPANRYGGRAPVGPIVLILIGVLYLLNSLQLVNFRHIGRFWPVILIVVGAYMLYNRVGPLTASGYPPSGRAMNSNPAAPPPGTGLAATPSSGAASDRYEGDR